MRSNQAQVVKLQAITGFVDEGVGSKTGGEQIIVQAKEGSAIKYFCAQGGKWKISIERMTGFRWRL